MHKHAHWSWHVIHMWKLHYAHFIFVIEHLESNCGIQRHMSEQKGKITAVINKQKQNKQKKAKGKINQKCRCSVKSKSKWKTTTAFVIGLVHLCVCFCRTLLWAKICFKTGTDRSAQLLTWKNWKGPSSSLELGTLGNTYSTKCQTNSTRTTKKNI